MTLREHLKDLDKNKDISVWFNGEHISGNVHDFLNSQYENENVYRYYFDGDFDTFILERDELETSTILGQLEKKIREIYQFDDDFRQLLLDTQQFLLGERDKHDEMTVEHGRFEFLVDLINEIIY